MVVQVLTFIENYREITASEFYCICYGYTLYLNKAVKIIKICETRKWSPSLRL